MSAQLEKRYFNVDEYYRMARAGVLKPDDRVELIEGEIIKMSPTGEGSYRNSRKYKRGETVVSHSVPGLKFEVKDILG